MCFLQIINRKTQQFSFFGIICKKIFHFIRNRQVLVTQEHSPSLKFTFCIVKFPSFCTHFIVFLLSVFFCLLYRDIRGQVLKFRICDAFKSDFKQVSIILWSSDFLCEVHDAPTVCSLRSWVTRLIMTGNGAREFILYFLLVLELKTTAFFAYRFYFFSNYNVTDCNIWWTDFQSDMKHQFS